MDDKSHYRSVASYRGMARIATAIGDTILAWSRAENALLNCMAAMLGVAEEDAVKFYARLPTFRQRSLAALSLVQLYPDFAETKKPILKLTKLSKTRNAFVHGHWIRNGYGDVRVFDITASDDDPNRGKPVRAADIHHHAYTVRVWTSELNQRVFDVVGTDGSTSLDLGGPDLHPPRNIRR